jgi:lysophospholipase L1-like esterase
MLKIVALVLAIVAAVQPAARPTAYNGEVVFVGSSTTAYWLNEGKSVWDQYYAPLGAVNVGVPGDQTQNTIDRLRGGSVANYDARVVVLHIGQNDLAANKSPQSVYDNIGTILNLLRSYLPRAKIILLAILPRGDATIHQRIRNANELIKRYENGNTVRVIDMSDKFAYGLGQVYTNLYRNDLLHYSTEGYRVWATNMATLFNSLYYG